MPDLFVFQNDYSCAGYKLLGNDILYRRWYCYFLCQYIIEY